MSNLQDTFGIEKLQNNQENCVSEPVLTTYASVAWPINTAIIMPNKATVHKLEVKIDQVEQDALSKTIMVHGVSIDSLCIRIKAYFIILQKRIYIINPHLLIYMTFILIIYMSTYRILLT